MGAQSMRALSEGKWPYRRYTELINPESIQPQICILERPFAKLSVLGDRSRHPERMGTLTPDTRTISSAKHGERRPNGLDRPRSSDLDRATQSESLKLPAANLASNAASAAANTRLTGTPGRRAAAAHASNSGAAFHTASPWAATFTGIG